MNNFYDCRFYKVGLTLPERPWDWIDEERNRIDWISENIAPDDYELFNSYDEVIEKSKVAYHWVANIRFRYESDLLLFKLRFGCEL